MELITILGGIAASITVASTIYVLYKRLKKNIGALNRRLELIEEKFKVLDQVEVTVPFCAKNIAGGVTFLEEGRVVNVISIKDGMIHFRTVDGLIDSSAEVSCFKPVPD